MGTKDEMVRDSLIRHFQRVIRDLRPLFTDYQHRLKHEQQLILPDGSVVARPETDPDMEIQLKIEIDYFNGVLPIKKLEEYCRAANAEHLARDYDDVCEIAAAILDTLLQHKPDDFQQVVLEALSDVQQPIEVHGEQSWKELGADYANYWVLKERHIKKIESKAHKIELFASRTDLPDALTKLQHSASIVEECNLKEKLCLKRALTLCRSLLRHSAKETVYASTIIDSCQQLVQECATRHSQDRVADKAQSIMAFECIGLLTMLDRSVFDSYANAFRACLTGIGEAEDTQEKAIAIKSVVDGLIIHGKIDDDLFRLLTTDCILQSEGPLHQLALEGTCKMLFAPQLCEDGHKDHIEAVLALLIMKACQSDPNFARGQPSEDQNPSHLKHLIIQQFLCNFVPMSLERCHLFRNGLFKALYAAIKAASGSLARSQGTLLTRMAAKMDPEQIFELFKLVYTRIESEKELSSDQSIEDGQVELLIGLVSTVNAAGEVDVAEVVIKTILEPTGHIINLKKCQNEVKLKQLQEQILRIQRTALISLDGRKPLQDFAESLGARLQTSQAEQSKTTFDTIESDARLAHYWREYALGAPKTRNNINSELHISQDSSILNSNFFQQRNQLGIQPIESEQHEQVLQSVKTEHLEESKEPKRGRKPSTTKPCPVKKEPTPATESQRRSTEISPPKRKRKYTKKAEPAPTEVVLKTEPVESPEIVQSKVKESKKKEVVEKKLQIASFLESQATVTEHESSGSCWEDYPKHRPN